MSIARHATRIGFLGAGLALLVLAGCGAAETSGRLPAGYRLVQKGEYQALYGPDGRIERLLQDRNQDGRADAVVVYGANGKPERGELDTDADGRVDRWEHLRIDGTIESVDLDTDGDGRVDRTEFPK